MTRATPALALLSVLIASSALADGPQTGIIDGAVLDAQNQPLPGATVQIDGPQGRRSDVTTAEGSFRFGLLPPGSYTVTASLEGLGQAAATITLEAGGRRTLELPLLSATEETITVTSAAELISKYDIATRSSLEAEVASELTFGTRDYRTSLATQAGLINNDGTAFQPALNGGSEFETGVYVDGVDTSITRRGGETRLLMPTSALEESRVESAGYTAEYGRSVGGIINSTVKSGTNEFRGQFLYIPQNNEWRAEQKAFEVPREDDVTHSFETALGGPIARDRAWFFASYSELAENKNEVTADGNPFPGGIDSEAAILKLNLQPTPRHQIALTGIDVPTISVLGATGSGDEFALCRCPIEGNLATGTWSYAVNSGAFLEAKVGTRDDDVVRQRFAVRAIQPGASPDDPVGNNLRYIDLGSGLRYNHIFLPQGAGFNSYPRDQANVALTLFRGAHELKFGADYQDASWENQTDIGAEYRGMGFNVNAPGGYAAPLTKRVFEPSGVIETTTDISALYAQDRFGVGDRWSLYYGLRLDAQELSNDIGQEVNSHSNVAPRLAAVYDVRADGALLLRATAGRYYQAIGQDIAFREFGRQPNGSNLFDEFRWNPVSRRYDIFVRSSIPVLDSAIQDVDPYYKDEATLGFDLKMGEKWAFTSRAVWWELGDLFWSTDQFDSAGRIVRDVRNWDDGFRDYRGLVLQVSRAFRDNWTVRMNYTWSDGDGNMFDQDDDDLFEGIGGVELGTGATDATIVNREGHGPLDRRHNLNLLGLKRWAFGRHEVTAGAFFELLSGEQWAVLTNTFVVHPSSGQRIQTTTFREPRDAQQLEDVMHLNLTGNWTFPLTGRVRGRVGVEVFNISNEQEAIFIIPQLGTPAPGVSGYQEPRELRLQVGVTF